MSMYSISKFSGVNVKRDDRVTEYVCMYLLLTTSSDIRKIQFTNNNEQKI